MTTIAWDGTTLVADRQNTINGTPVPVRKVHRATSPTGEVWLYGIAGDGFDCEGIHAAIEGKEHGNLDAEDVAVIAIGPDRKVWLSDGKAQKWVPIGRRKWAIGSGGDYALGALHAGKTASEAVRIAAKLDIHTGCGADAVSF